MKKNLRVVQINGFRGLFLSLFIVSCLIAGFIAFPSFLTMNGWNYIAAKTGSMPLINYWQGMLLWAIIVFSLYISAKRKFIVAFNSQQELTEDEVKEVVSKIKSQAFEHHILSSKDFPETLKAQKELKEEELKESQPETKNN